MKNSRDHVEAKKPAAIILAAGRGSRFGGEKLMARLPSGEIVIDLVIKKTIQAFDDYCCVVRADDTNLQQHLDKNQWRWVIANRADEGMSQSLIRGMETFPKAAGWFFVLADMPYLLSSTFVKLRRSFIDSNYQPRIIVPCHKGKAGNPIGLSEHFKLDLGALKGDVGARSIVKQYRDARIFIDVEDAGIFHDIDHPNDMIEQP